MSHGHFFGACRDRTAEGGGLNSNKNLKDDRCDRRPSGKEALKRNLCADLHVAATDRSRADGAGARRTVGVWIHRIIEVAVRSAKIRMVKNIGGVCTELQAHAFGEVESLTHREVRCIDSRS